MERRNNTLNNNDRSELYLLLPIILITTIFMFIARVKILPVYVDGMYWYTGENYTIDILLYWKKILFVAVTVIGTVVLLMDVVLGKAKIYKNKVYIPMAIFCVFVILSYIFSPYKEIAANGYMDRQESTIVLVCYMLITFYAMNAIRSEKGVKIICTGFAVACTILGVWGVLEMLVSLKIASFPVWTYASKEIAEVLKLESVGAIGYVEWFFTNRNYTSAFMVIPISIFSMITIGSEDKKKKIFFAVLTGLMFYSLWNASSTGGILGVVSVFVMGIIVFGFNNIKKWGKSIGIILICTIISIVASLPAIIAEFGQSTGINVTSKVLDEPSDNAVEVASSEPVTQSMPDVKPSNVPQYFDIDSIKTEGNKAIFSFEGEIVTVAYKNADDVTVTDSTGNDIGLENKYFNATVVQGKIKNTGQTTSFIEITTAKNMWPFAVSENVVYFLSQSGQGILLDGETDAWGFKGHENFATNRGYIWSRSLPLIKDTIFIGHGADTFEIFFPQDDYTGRYNAGMYTNDAKIRVDKPHNMYIGTAVNTGLISLVALLAVYLMYILESFKIYRKREYTMFIEYVGAAIMLATTGIMVNGISVDSIVSVMAVSFAFMGVGFAINRLVTKK